MVLVNVNVFVPSNISNLITFSFYFRNVIGRCRLARQIQVAFHYKLIIYDINKMCTNNLGNTTGFLQTSPIANVITETLFRHLSGNSF